MQIGLRSTRIQTRDDVMITIPNSIITNTKIINQSSPKPMFRVRVKISVAYGSDIRQVETVLAEQVRSNPLAAQDPKPQGPFSRIRRLFAVLRAIVLGQTPPRSRKTHARPEHRHLQRLRQVRHRNTVSPARRAFIAWIGMKRIMDQNWTIKSTITIRLK